MWGLIPCAIQCLHFLLFRLEYSSSVSGGCVKTPWKVQLRGARFYPSSQLWVVACYCGDGKVVGTGNVRHVMTEPVRAKKGPDL